MKFKKMPRQVRLLIAGGLLMITAPTLIADFVHIPDFVRGCVIGLGFELEIAGWYKMRQIRKGVICSNSAESESKELV